jgi:hypothetical protein
MIPGVPSICVKQVGHAADHTLLSSAHVTNKHNCTFTPTHAFIVCKGILLLPSHCLRQILYTTPQNIFYSCGKKCHNKNVEIPPKHNTCDQLTEVSYTILYHAFFELYFISPTHYLSKTLHNLVEIIPTCFSTSTPSSGDLSPNYS